MAVKQHRYIRNILYNLKKVFGQPLTLYKFVSKTRDIDSGLITRLFFVNTISRAVIFPDVMTRDFVYDLAYIAANKNFTTGAFFDRTDRQILIDNHDLTLNVPVQINDCISFDGNLYDVKRCEELEESRATVVLVTRILTTPTISEQGVVTTPTVPKQLTIGPDLIRGVALSGEDINEGDLVFQNGGTVMLASNDNALRPCIGIVTAILNGIIFHSRVTVVESLAIEGTYGATHRTIYLGTNGKVTFDIPTSGLVQPIGFATNVVSGSNYEAAINISNNIINL